MEALGRHTACASILPKHRLFMKVELPMAMGRCLTRIIGWTTKTT